MKTSRIEPREFKSALISIVTGILLTVALQMTIAKTSSAANQTQSAQLTLNQK